MSTYQHNLWFQIKLICMYIYIYLYVYICIYTFIFVDTKCIYQKRYKCSMCTFIICIFYTPALLVVLNRTQHVMRGVNRLIYILIWTMYLYTSYINMCIHKCIYILIYLYMSTHQHNLWFRIKLSIRHERGEEQVVSIMMIMMFT
jgi:hypothetical protein